MEKINPLISVVVPVYKVEEYLERCVDSIINQTYLNLEIILVDDGSPDKCPMMCEEYARKDRRIRVIHKENGGLSSARNAGTKIAKGKYISYVDSDDIISSEYIDYLYYLICKHKTLISTCRILDCKEIVVNGDGKDSEFVLKNSKALEMMLYQREFTTSASGKLYSMQLKEYLYFPVGRKHEDLMTIYKTLYYGAPIAYGQKQLYFYMHHQGSIMTEQYSTKSLDLKYAADDLYNFVENQCPEIIEAARSRKFSCYCQLLSFLPQKELESELGDILWSWICQNRIRILRNSYTRTKNKVGALITYFGRKNFQRIRNVI